MARPRVSARRPSIVRMAEKQYTLEKPKYFLLGGATLFNKLLRDGIVGSAERRCLRVGLVTFSLGMSDIGRFVATTADGKEFGEFEEIESFERELLVLLKSMVDFSSVTSRMAICFSGSMIAITMPNRLAKDTRRTIRAVQQDVRCPVLVNAETPSREMKSSIQFQ